MDWLMLGLGFFGVAAIAFLIWAIIRPKRKTTEKSSEQLPAKANEAGRQVITKWTLLLVWNIVLTLAVCWGFLSGMWEGSKPLDQTELEEYLK